VLLDVCDVLGRAARVWIYYADRRFLVQ